MVRPYSSLLRASSFVRAHDVGKRLNAAKRLSPLRYLSSAGITAGSATSGLPKGIINPVTYTKIIATLGPASESDDAIRSLILKGTRVFRLNFSHGNFDGHLKRLETVRRVSKDLGIAVAVAGDLQGPKIRVGTVPAGIGEKSPSGGGTLALQTGDEVVLSSTAGEALLRKNSKGQDEAVLSLTYPDLVHEVSVGHKVLINDGAIRMVAVSTDAIAGELRCRVLEGGKVTSGKGINLPESNISAPAITERDWECVAWAVEHGLDYLALSFVRKADEVYNLRSRLKYLEAKKHGQVQIIQSDNPMIGIISKIEKPQALAHLDSIVEASDAVMVARGDLGVEMDIESVPITQKQIVERCSLFGKPCIIATQMLETMIQNNTPTRAEASDVANAIFDGADAVMLSAETATGRHPTLVVETMTKIVAAAEKRLMSMIKTTAPPTRFSAGHLMTAAMAHGAWHTARDAQVKYVVCWSQHGNTARYLSQNAFDVPIIAFSEEERSVQQMALFNAVTPVHASIPGNGSLRDLTDFLDKVLISNALAHPGDRILVVAGRPLGTVRATNTIQLHVVGSTPSLFPPRKGRIAKDDLVKQ